MFTLLTPTYDRKLHQYRIALPSGELLSAPTRTEAEWAYLSAIAPEVAEKARRIEWANPLLANRVRRGCFIAVEGGVQPCQEPVVYGSHNLSFTRVAWVHSERFSDKTYQILVRDHRYYCDCPDAQGRTTEVGTEEAQAPASKISDHTCKHILAYVLSED